MTKEELYEWYQSEINKYSQELLSEGQIADCANNSHDYKIVHGRNLDFAVQCDREWKNYMLNLLLNIKTENNEADFIDIVDSLPFHDSHWQWFTKYRCLKSSEYDWFYVIADNKVQAICITNHPKESLFDKQDIFYIEYIAVAPWNRKSEYIKRKFHGLGALLIKAVCKYFNTAYHYRYGFSLSAVPQAKSFYGSIGMTAFPEYDHDSLSFYEMNEENTINFLGGSK